MEREGEEAEGKCEQACIAMTAKPLSAYLDTCIISGLAQNDLDQGEANAMLELLRLNADGAVQLCTSAVALSELEKIPTEHPPTSRFTTY